MWKVASDLYFSCPAVSHSCTRMLMLLLSFTTFFEKSTPMVVFFFSE
jgi:hypothetical protein